MLVASTRRHGWVRVERRISDEGEKYILQIIAT